MGIRKLWAGAVILACVAAIVAAPTTAGAADWTPASVGLPAGSTAGVLEAVSCPAAGSCTAVGQSSGGADPNDLKPMAVTESGGVWGQGATVARPVGATATTLLGVSCPTVGSCVAVGYEQAPGAYYVPKVPVVAVETDGTWGATFPIAPPGGATYAVLDGVSCPAVGSCVAVGGDESGPFAAAETDGTWGAAVQIRPKAPATGEPPSPSPFTFGEVSCPALGTCVGAGVTWSASGEPGPGVATMTTGDWGEAQLITPPVAAAASLTSVSCPTIGSCAAVGGDGADPFAIGYTGGTWGGAASIAPPDSAPSASLSGVSCPASGSCLAVGSFYPGNEPFEGRPMLAPESGDTWGQSVALAAPAGARYAWLEGVSCPAAGPCAAVGISGWTAVGSEQLPVVYSGEPPVAGSPPPGGSGAPGPALTVTTIGSGHGGGGGHGGNAPACSIALGSTTIAFTKAHVAKVRLSDTGAGPCRGTITISLTARKAKSGRGKAKSRKLASGTLRIDPGEKTKVTLRLTATGKHVLAGAHGVVRAGLMVEAGKVMFVRTVRLRQSGSKRVHVH